MKFVLSQFRILSGFCSFLRRILVDVKKLYQQKLSDATFATKWKIIDNTRRPLLKIKFVTFTRLEEILYFSSFRVCESNY